LRPGNLHWHFPGHSLLNTSGSHSHCEIVSRQPIPGLPSGCVTSGQKSGHLLCAIFAVVFRARTSPRSAATSIVQWSLPFRNEPNRSQAERNEVARFSWGSLFPVALKEGQGETQRSRRFCQTACNSGRLRDDCSTPQSTLPRVGFLRRRPECWLQNSRPRKTNKPVNHAFGWSGITERALRETLSHPIRHTPFQEHDAGQRLPVWPILIQCGKSERDENALEPMQRLRHGEKVAPPSARVATRRSRPGGNKLRALADKVDGPQGEKPEPGCRCVSPKSKMCGKYRETIYICWTLEIFEIRRECKCLCETKPICIVSSWTYKIEPVD